MNPPSVIVEGLGISYGARTLLQDISFHLDSPGFLSIVGRNGSGKTSILKAITGELEHEGSIRIQGKLASDFNESTFSSLIAFLPQKLELGINMTLEELVAFGRIRFRKPFKGLSPDDQVEIENSLNLFDLGSLRKSYLNEVSGGEKQLAWLAQVISQDTPIIILDEPTLNLDLSNRKFVFEVLKGLVEEKGKLVILVTHELEYLDELKGKILDLSQNKIELKDNSSELLSAIRSRLEERVIRK